MSGLVELKITFCIPDLSFRKELKSNIINILKERWRWCWLVQSKHASSVEEMLCLSMAVYVLLLV